MAIDGNTNVGRRALIFAAKQALNSGDCGSAYSKIFQIFDSPGTDNEIRMLMASTYGCFAGIRTLTILGNIANDPLATSAFFRFVTKYFPSTLTPTDKQVEYGQLAIYALLAAVREGVVVNSVHKVNAGTDNEGSLLQGDRASDANNALFFVAMQVMGAMQNRYGAPDATYAPTAAVPYFNGVTAGAVDAVGCQYASAVVHLADGLGAVTSTVQGPAAPALQSIQGLIASGIYTNCDLGCTGALGSGCAIAAGCATCPIALRDPSACTGVVTDEASCAAAGVLNMVQNLPMGWN